MDSKDPYPAGAGLQAVLARRPRSGGERRQADRRRRIALRHIVTVLACLAAAPVVAMGQGGSAPPPASYVVGAQDVLTIMSYDQSDLSGRFTVESDGTFTYPLIGRFKAGG